MTLSITERPNPLTLNLDVADPVGIVRLLRQSDAQVFSGFEEWPALVDEEMIEAVALFAYRLSKVIVEGEGRVILAGAGTSGRLARLMSNDFNRILREERLPEVFLPLIAGGDFALVMSQESAEDNVSAAAKEWREASPESVRRGIYVGISAGLSAPYVGAQLELAVADDRFHTVLIGFNPAQLARSRAVEGWEKTFDAVLESALQSPRFLLLNPIYGPEAVTGSTRMKGATVTKILLETAFVTALEIVRGDVVLGEKEALGEENLLPLRSPILRRFHQYEATVRAVYENVEGLSELLKLAGMALRSDGRLYFLGRGNAGLLGIFDCSECPPTFGADPFDVRGFVLEGWELLGLNSQTMAARGRAYGIGHDRFESEYLPEVSRGDFVMGVAIQNLGESTRRLLGESQKARASTALLMVVADGARPTNAPEDLRRLCLVEVPEAGFLPGMQNLCELALKIALNIVTTGAHVMSGKIYRNKLLDLRISNSKLFHRAVGLIAQLARVDEAAAVRALMHAILKRAPTDEEATDMTVGVAVTRAAGRTRIVPLAVLLALGRFTYEEAYERLASEPRVRRTVDEELRASYDSPTE